VRANESFSMIVPMKRTQLRRFDSNFPRCAADFPQLLRPFSGAFAQLEEAEEE
jgi:hypothetical protein